ncbi:MAG TPA: response regulator [Terriglobales bacterium]|nr:response regulator [Terriglobales bacterium]
MRKLLIVDDESSMRNMLRMRLSDTYDVVATEDPEQAIALALNHKPDAILMDLMMPRCSGFELCQSLRTLSYTALIPIFVISGEAGSKYRDHCKSIGAKGYFEKPINFDDLRKGLETELNGKPAERRAHVRVRMRVTLRIKGVDVHGMPFEETTQTENVSCEGFLAPCRAELTKSSIVDVFVAGDRFAGRARAVRKEGPGAPWQKYGFHFDDRTAEWVLHSQWV